jgi:hypothetical protein
MLNQSTSADLKKAYDVIRSNPKSIDAYLDLIKFFKSQLNDQKSYGQNENLFISLYLDLLQISQTEGSGVIEDLKIFLSGFLQFVETGITLPESHLAQVRLYCKTNGRFQELASKIISDFYPNNPISKISGILGDYDAQEVQNIVSDIRENGYHIFKNKLPGALCDLLQEFATSTPSTPMMSNGQKFTDMCYSPDAQNGIVKYQLSEDTLLKNAAVQKIIFDPSVLGIAQEYLSCQPIFTNLSMWWSCASDGIASSEAAQMYHFDLDSFKWLKFFIYLTDVTPSNGPHVYVKGSHKSGSKPHELLSRGYSRIPDRDIFQFYPQKDIVEITAPRGTIIAGDTSCWHKGKPLDSGHRLIFQPVYGNTLFANCLGTVPPSNQVRESLTFLNLDDASWINSFPRLLSRYQSRA